MTTLSSVVLGPAIYASLKRGPVLTETIGAISIGLAGFISFALPRDIGMVDSTPAEESENEERKTNIFLLPFVQIKEIFGIIRDLVRQSKYLGFLLFSLIFTTVGELEAQIRKQYAAKRYHWDWSTVRST